MSSAAAPLTVLLVDDHPLVRMGIRAALQRHFPEAEVFEAGDGAEALALVDAHPATLALVDVHLPGTSGVELVRQLRAAERTARVLMVAGEADPWTVNEALAAGATGFLNKSSSSDLLPQALRTVLEGGVFLCPASQQALQRVEHSALTPVASPGPSVLSPREREVLRYLAQGETTKSVAGLLGISPKTVETHRSHIMRKLRTNSIAVLVRYAIRHGLTLP